jgi:hypothetical protein
MIFIYHHLGLGDHILCNGLVREVAKWDDAICVFCKHKNYASVTDMYHDNSQINVLAFADDADVEKFLKVNSCNVLRIGATGINWNEHSEKHFDELFYEQAGLPFSKKYDSFYIDYDKSEPEKKDPFVFLHDDPSRGYNIRYGLTQKNIITPANNGGSIFDHIPLLLYAEEIHCIDSAFLCLADLLNVKGKKFFHRYARKEDKFFKGPKLKDDWTIYD